MANTTDLVITCLDEDEVLFQIASLSDIDFQKISDSAKSGGPKRDVGFSSYAACYRCLDEEKLQFLINIFKSAPFVYPELAVLIIDDDINEEISGAYLRISPNK